MADQAINALPTKDTPESTDQLLLIGDAEEKIIDYDKLADAILNKLTSKKFEMDTGTQTIMEAIASLNGKSRSLAFNQAYVITTDGMYLLTFTMHTTEYLTLEPFICLIIYNTGELQYRILHENSRYTISITNNTFKVNSDYEVGKGALILLG